MITDNLPVQHMDGWAVALVLIVKEILMGFRAVTRLHKRIDLSNKRQRKIAAKVGLHFDDDEDGDS